MNVAKRPPLSPPSPSIDPHSQLPFTASGSELLFRCIVDVLAVVKRGGAPTRNDALKKAVKVLGDQGEKNPFAKTDHSMW